MSGATNSFTPLGSRDKIFIPFTHRGQNLTSRITSVDLERHVRVLSKLKIYMRHSPLELVQKFNQFRTYLIV